MGSSRLTVTLARMTAVFSGARSGSVAALNVSVEHRARSRLLTLESQKAQQLRDISKESFVTVKSWASKQFNKLLAQQ